MKFNANGTIEIVKAILVAKGYINNNIE